MEKFLTCLATVSTCAAAIAAWMSYRTSEQSLRFQKNIAQNQHHLQKLTSISTKMAVLKGLLSNVFEISDENYTSIEPFYLEIKSDLQTLAESEILKENPSSFFSASSLGEAIAQRTNYRNEINHEIGRIEKAVSDVFS